jgi:predicted MFS family arabinose efflux permease
MASNGFALMLAAQMLMVIARAMFWPATWSMASQLAGNSARHMGRLNSITNAGQIAGTAAAGFLIAASGFPFSFGILAAVGLASLAFNQAFRQAAAASGGPAGSIFATYRMLFQKRTIRYAVLCSYISALPVSLSFSFYPILLVEQGFDSNATGTLISLRGVGAIIGGIMAGYLVTRVRGGRAPLAAAVIVGASVALCAAVSQSALIAFFLFIVGVGSALMTLYFQMLISHVSSREARGSAMALGGLGWSLSHLSVPLAMGFINDAIGVHVAFYAVGGFALLCGVALVPLQRWAFAGEPADGPEQATPEKP